MKKTQFIYKGIVILLAAALLLVMLGLGGNLHRKDTQPINNPIMQITPEADLPVPGEVLDDQQQTEPPQTDPPETEPPETEPDETEPPPSEPEETTPSEPAQPTQPEDPGSDPEQGGSEPSPGEGPEDDTELRLQTSLKYEYTYNELVNDVLPFTASLKNGGDLILRVKVMNSLTPQNGKYLTAENRNYEATLCRNETNFFYFYAKNGTETVTEWMMPVRYVAQMADEENPQIGEHPPIIVTNLEGVTQLSNRNFTLTVQATAYTGQFLYSNHIEVIQDGHVVSNPTGGPRYEYQLYFPNPDSGDVTNHTVTVRAWDDEGNSTFKIYRFEYHFVDTGGEIGTAYIIIDATTVGLGIMNDAYTYRIKQNVPASYAVMEALEEWGYEFSYGGTPDVGFYLRRISCGGMMDYYEIPDNLWNKILQDELNMTGQYNPNSLGEFDFTQGSGWMYSIDGQVYAGKGLSNYFLSNGDTLYIRFTLAYGKDIGGFGSTGGNYGILSSYCGKWINETYIDQHQWGQQTIIQEPTCTEDGTMCCTCSVCGDTKDAVAVPALGHSFAVTETVEPADGNDGYTLSVCQHCGEEWKEIIPWKDEETTLPESSA